MENETQHTINEETEKIVWQGFVLCKKSKVPIFKKISAQLFELIVNDVRADCETSLSIIENWKAENDRISSGASRDLEWTQPDGNRLVEIISQYEEDCPDVYSVVLYDKIEAELTSAMKEELLKGE